MWGRWISSGSTKVKYLAQGEVNPFLEAMQEAKKGTVITPILLTRQSVALLTGYPFISTIVLKNVCKIHLMTSYSHFCSSDMQKLFDFHL